MGQSLNYTWEILKIFFYLGAIIALIYTLNHYLRNSRGYFAQQGSMVRVIDKGFLSQHAQVYIVQVGDKYYLLGVAGEKITLLDTFNDLSFVKEESYYAGAQNYNNTVNDLNVKFREILKRTFGKKDGGDE